jgi:hypothetical protein
LEQKGPIHRIESFGNIQEDRNALNAITSQSIREEEGEQNRVLNAPIRQESALFWADSGAHGETKACGEEFSQ